MAVHCVSEECRREIDESWAFCPACGTDNRPPEAQHPVPDHQHEYVVNEPCCLLCGGVRGYVGSGRAQRVKATLALGLGLIFFAVFANFMCVLAFDTGIYVREIQQMYQAGGRRSVGGSVAWIFFMLGFSLCWYALAIFFPKDMRDYRRQHRNDNAYWNYEDDKPWWKRRRW